MKNQILVLVWIALAMGMGLLLEGINMRGFMDGLIFGGLPVVAVSRFGLMVAELLGKDTLKWHQRLWVGSAFTVIIAACVLMV